MADLWLKHPKTGVVWLVTHEDTQKRCLSEGFTLAPDPRLPAPEPPAAPDQSETPPAPAAVSSSLDTADTQIAESPDELAELAALAEEAALAAVRERNTAARTAFGVPQAPQPAPNVRRGLKHANPPHNGTTH